MKVCLIRHLPTEWNKKNLLQGKKDISILNISTEDKLQMEKNLQFINTQRFDKVLTSTLKRTQQTANMYGYNVFQAEPLLDELNFGIFEGLPKSKLIEGTNNSWIEDPKTLVLGESLQNFEDRLILFLSKYRRYKKILIFGHGAVIRALISINNGKNIDSMNKIEIQNNSITIL